MRRRRSGFGVPLGSSEARPGGRVPSWTVVIETRGAGEARADLRTQIAFERTLNFLLQRANVKEVDPSLNKVDDENKKS